MALDPLEREHLRKKMATKMSIFLEGGSSVSCVSAHYHEEPALCELCQGAHANELIVIKNRSQRKMHVDLACLKEMIRFRVTDADDLTRWIPKLVELRSEYFRRKATLETLRMEERKRLEKKVIVRKREAP